MAPGRLYVCATPIGNLEDVSFRLLRVLGEVDLVAAEDTRRTMKLLTHYDIHSRMTSYHEANEPSRTAELLSHLERGEAVALVTDAGMPSVSDPGYHLIRACIDAGVAVEVLPGPSAVLTALVASGIAPARFAFEGFLSRKPGERRRRLEALVGDDRTLIFFEAPTRLVDALTAMHEVFGPRPAAVARELTKMHEEVVRGTLAELVATFGAVDEVRGEIVVVVEGRLQAEADLPAAILNARQLQAEGLAKSAAAAQAAAAFGVPRRDVYDGLLAAEPGDPER